MKNSKSQNIKIEKAEDKFDKICGKLMGEINEMRRSIESDEVPEITNIKNLMEMRVKEDESSDESGESNGGDEANAPNSFVDLDGNSEISQISMFKNKKGSRGSIRKAEDGRDDNLVGEKEAIFEKKIEEIESSRESVNFNIEPKVAAKQSLYRGAEEIQFSPLNAKSGKLITNLMQEDEDLSLSDDEFDAKNTPTTFNLNDDDLTISKSPNTSKMISERDSSLAKDFVIFEKPKESVEIKGTLSIPTTPMDDRLQIIRPKKELNLMEDINNNSIYDTMTTNTNKMTSNKKDFTNFNSSNYHSIDLNKKFSSVAFKNNFGIEGIDEETVVQELSSNRNLEIDDVIGQELRLATKENRLDTIESESNVINLIEEMDEDALDGDMDKKEVDTPVKSMSSMCESIKERGGLQKIIGEIAQERSTAKKKKVNLDFIKKNPNAVDFVQLSSDRIEASENKIDVYFEEKKLKKKKERRKKKRSGSRNKVKTRERRNEGKKEGRKYVDDDTYKIENLKNRLQRMIKDISNDIEVRETKLRKSRETIKKEKSSNSINLFSYSMNSSDHLRTPEMAKHQDKSLISDMSVFRKKDSTGDLFSVKEEDYRSNDSLKFNRYSKRLDCSFNDHVRDRKVPAIPGFKQVLLTKVDEEAVLTFEDRAARLNQQNDVKKGIENIPEKSLERSLSAICSSGSSALDSYGKETEDFNYLTPNSRYLNSENRLKSPLTSKSTVFDALTDTNRLLINPANSHYEDKLSSMTDLMKNNSTLKKFDRHNNTPKLMKRRRERKMSKIISNGNSQEFNLGAFTLESNFEAEKNKESPHGLKAPSKSSRRKAPWDKSRVGRRSYRNRETSYDYENTYKEMENQYQQNHHNLPPNLNNGNYASNYGMQIPPSKILQPVYVIQQPMGQMNGQYPIFAPMTPNMYNPYPNGYPPMGMYDPYFMGLMQRYGKMRPIEQYNTNGKDPNEEYIRDRSEYYNSEDPKNQRFMKIKEYLDDRESEFLNSGDKIKSFESNLDSPDTLMENSSLAKNNGTRRKKVDDFIREIKNFSPSFADSDEQNAKARTTRAIPEAETNHFNDDSETSEGDNKVGDVDYFSKPVEIKSPVKFTIHLDDPKMRKFRSKKRNAFLEVGDRRTKIDDYQNRPELSPFDVNKKQSKMANDPSDYDLEEMTPESCYKENFEPFIRVNKFDLEGKLERRRRRSNSK